MNKPHALPVGGPLIKYPIVTTGEVPNRAWLIHPGSTLFKVTSLVTIRFPARTDVTRLSPYGVNTSLWLVCRLTALHVEHTTAMT